MKKSIIHSIRFLFSSYYLLFSLLVFGIFFLVIQQDYWFTINQAFTENRQKIRQLETLYENRLNEIKEDIHQLTLLKTEQDAQYLRQHYPKVSDSLLKKHLSIGQYNQVKRSKIFPPIIIQVFQFKDHTFKKLDRSIRSLFDKKPRLISSSDQAINIHDFPLAFDIKKLNIKLKTLPKIQNFELSKEDLLKLNELGNRNRSYFFENDHFSQILYEDLIHTGSDDFSLLTVKKSGVSYANNSKKYFSQSAFGLWIYQYIIRLENRLGIRPNSFMDMINFVFPDPLQKRATFINARSIQANQSVYWNCYPNDYGTKDGDRQKDRFLIMPHTIATATIDKSQMIHSIIPSVVLDPLNNISYGVQLEVSKQSLLHSFDSQSSNKHFSHFLKTGSKPQFFTDYQNTFSTFDQSPKYFQNWYEQRKEEPTTNKTFKFSFLNERNEVYFATSAISKKLSGSRITIYQSKDHLFFYFYLRWLVISLIYFVTIPLFFSLKKRYTFEISESIRESLYFIVHEQTESFHDDQRLEFHETENLKSKMQNLITKVSNERFYHRLNLGLRSILNTPHKPFKYYLEEMYYFSRDLSTDFCWKMVDQPTHSKSCLSLHFDQDHQNFLKTLSLPPTLYFQFKGHIDKNSREFKIFATYFKELVEKSFLEAEFFKKQKLDSDLELGENVLKSLIPSQKMVKTSRYQINSTYIQGTYIAGDFYTFKEVDDRLYFYLADLSRTGLGASLIASYLKPFLDSIIEKNPKPSELLHMCNQFLTKKNFSDLFVTMFYGTIDLKTNVLQYSCAGLRPMLLVSQQIEDLSTNGIPLGISLDAEYQTKELQLKSGEFIYCYTRELLSAFNPQHSQRGLVDLRYCLSDTKDLDQKVNELHTKVTDEEDSLQDDFMQLAIQML